MHGSELPAIDLGCKPGCDVLALELFQGRCMPAAGFAD
jgi:hypothetical protein